ncbi:MAG: AraC family transcriptional regulator [Calditrichaeota bacterium]|nr:AraC family transcriptional regulator [Calditrichota bacterium]
MFTIDVYTLIASFGVFHSLILAILFRNEKNRTLYNKLFSLLLIAASIRILKDVLINLYRIDPRFSLTTEIWLLIENIGYSHTFALGPLFYLYFRSRLFESKPFKRNDLFHFSPYILLIPSAFVLPFEFWLNGALIASYAHFLCYYLLSANLFFRFYREHTNDRPIKKWLLALLITVFILMLTYLQTAMKMIGGIAGALLYTVAIVVLTILIYQDRKMMSAKKYGTSSLGSERISGLADDLKRIMQSEQLFLDSTLSVHKLAARLKISTAHLSQVINEEFGQGYAEFVNNFRIDYAKNKLKENTKKIAEIAYESGFDSLSSFNSSFKRLTGSTPSDFRNSL